MRPIDIVKRDFDVIKDRIRESMHASKDAQRLLDEHIALPLRNLEESAKSALAKQKRGIMKECDVTLMALDIAELAVALDYGEELIGRRRYT